VLLDISDPGNARRARSSLLLKISRRRPIIGRMERVVAVSLLGTMVWSAASCGPTRGSTDHQDAGTGEPISTLPPEEPPLASLDVLPPEQTLQLSLQADGTVVPATATFMATGWFGDETYDITTKTYWTSDSPGATVVSGVATVTAPGSFAITAHAGSIQGSAKLTATVAASLVGAAFDPAVTATLDASPAGEARIEYPLDGSLFPSNLGPIVVHVTGGARSIARLELAGGGVDVRWYDVCLADPTQAPGPGCYVELPLALTRLFTAASQSGDVTLTARVGDGGSPPAESAPIHVAFADVPLTGALYYWSAIEPGATYPGYTLPPAATVGASVQRYDLGRAPLAPELVYTDQGTPPAFAGAPYARAPDGGVSTCVGCHAVSLDGKLASMSVGGSASAGFELLDVARATLLPITLTASEPTQRFVRESCGGDPAGGCGAFTAFGPTVAGSASMVSMYRSKLWLRVSDGVSTLANQAEVVPSAADPYRTDPFWSQRGDAFAFTGFAAPSVGTGNADGLDGDEKVGGQIWVASASATAVHDDARLVVPREDGVTSYYPAISSDGRLLAFDKSTCGTGAEPEPHKGALDYGNGPCDGYDDWTATLWLTTPAGGRQTRLDRANGPAAASNSWPRFSPNAGSFRAGTLHWIVFSSRRPYGTQVNYGVTPPSQRPQLWIAGVFADGEVASDPSFAPVWLPNQNPSQALPSSNHTPQWAAVAVPLPP
jgi:hypothetical protein